MEDKLPKICFTGTCPDYTRAELIEMVENEYEVKDSVTKDLDILVCEDPDSGSSKLQKAEKYGVKIMSYDDFLEMVENGEDEDNEDEAEMGPVVKVRITGINDYSCEEIPLERIWFANDKCSLPEKPSDNCVGIEAVKFDCWMDEEDDDEETFICEWEGVNLLTADENGKTVSTSEWHVQDLVKLIKDKGLIIKNLFAKLEDCVDGIVITSLVFEDEDGEEFELKDGVEGMEPVDIEQQNQLYELIEALSEQDIEIDEDKVSKVEAAFGIEAPYELKAMISKCTDNKDNILIRGEFRMVRIITFNEVLNTDIDLFKEEGFIPVMRDRWEQSYFVYNSKKNTWLNVESGGKVYFEDEDLCTVLQVYHDDVD